MKMFQDVRGCPFGRADLSEERDHGSGAAPADCRAGQ